MTNRVALPKSFNLVHGTPSAGKNREHLKAVHLGVDVGRSGGKVSAVPVYEDERSEPVISGPVCEAVFPVKFIKGSGGRSFVDTDETLKGIVEALFQTNAKLGEQIGSGRLKYARRLVTVDTFGSGAGIQDQNRTTMLRGIYDYLDPEWQAGMDKAVRLLGGDKQAAFRRIFDATAGNFSCGVYLLYHLLGIIIYERVATGKLSDHEGIVALPEAINYSLMNNPPDFKGHKIDESWARLTLLADRTGLEWSSHLIQRLGFHFCQFPHIASSGIELGDLQKDLLASMGAEAGKVVLGAMHDSAAAFAFFGELGGLDVINVSSGSWNVIGMPVMAKELGRQDLMDAMFEAGIGVEGATGYQYAVQNVMGSMLTDPLFILYPEIAKGDFAALFKGIEGEDIGFAYVNCMSEIFTRAFDPGKPETLRAAITAYCGQTGQAVPATRQEIAKTMLLSMLMGMADRVKAYTRLMNMLGTKPNRIQAGGGLLMSNDLLCQALAGATGLNVQRTHIRAAGLGNTLLALNALKMFPKDDIHNALVMASSGDMFWADKAVQDMWQRAFEEYLAVKAKE